MADTEGLGQFIKRDDGGFLLPFSSPLLLAEAGGLGKLLPRQAGLFPALRAFRPTQLAHTHARRSADQGLVIDLPEPSAAGGQQIQGCDFDDVGRSSQAQQELSVTQATHTCENLARVDFERLRHVEELNDVHTTFTALILGHERLRAAERFGNFGLGEALVLACGYQLFQQPALAGRSKGFRHQMNRPEGNRLID